jgi:nucleotide-binding universal stress UspA family protein
MKVLVGVDGSSNSLATVALIGRVISAARDELVLAYVSPGVPYLADEQLDAGVAARAQAALSGAVFDEALTRLPAEWQSNAERAELSGSPSAGLLAAADARGVDLIAVGFRGAGLFERFMLGSVSRAVVQSASVPVLVVKSEQAPDQAALGKLETVERPVRAGAGPPRVLAAYDGAEMGERIAATSAQLSWPKDTEGLVINVVPPMFVTDLPSWLQPMTRDDDVRAMAEAWQKEHNQQKEAALQILRQFQQSLPACFQASEPIVAEGRPGDQILEAIAEEKIDLVLVGNRGRGGVVRMLLGSTTDQVLNQAPCSVLIVR